MSTNNHASSKSWWPLKSPSFAPSREFPYDAESRPGSSSASSPGGSGLKSFASAMGFSKSRKQDSGYMGSRPPNLASTSYERSSGSASSGYGAQTSNGQSSRKPGRPPSNSVSSTLRSESFDDEPVPRTPSDVPRNSMMSLSEDPFAAGSLHSPRIEPLPGSRVSAYSNHSGLDVLPKGATGSPLLFNGSTRDSYASSSSREMYRATPSSPRVASPGTGDHSLYANGSSRQRVVSVGRHDVRRPSDLHLFTPPHFTSTSSTTLTDKNRLSQPSTSSLQARPPMRARGMTDVGPGQSLVQFLRSEPPSPAGSSGSGSHRRTDDLAPPMLSHTDSHSSHSSTGPRLVVRAASVSRAPPTAPPNLHLPPTPTEQPPYDPPMFASPLASVAPPPPPVAPLTIIRKSSNNRSPLALDDSRPPSASRLAVQIAAHLEPSPIINNSAHGTPRTLKKAASQSSLHKKASVSSISSLKLSAEDRAPRKQRSFNHPKIPLPDVPALPSGVTSASNPNTPYNLVDKDKRGSSSSRRRLFSSGSLRTSSLQFPDDQASLSHEDFAARLDGQRYQQTSSFWDEDKESNGSVPASPIARQRSPQHEYHPQQIMSPSEMLKVEASYNRGSVYVRERGQSVASMSSLASASTTRTAMSNMTLGGSGHGHGNVGSGPVPSGSTPRHSNPVSPIAPPVDSHHHHHAQDREEAYNSPSLHPHSQPRPNNTSARPYTQRTSSERLSPMPCYNPPTPEINSLPAPPRRRANSRPSTASAVPTPLPYQVTRAPSSASARTAMSQRSQEFIRTRKSIMRKPSFLEIDDEVDRDAQRLVGGRAGGCTFAPEPDSFLDLRPSIDSVRGIEAPS